MWFASVRSEPIHIPQPYPAVLEIDIAGEVVLFGIDFDLVDGVIQYEARVLPREPLDAGAAEIHAAIDIVDVDREIARIGKLADTESLMVLAAC